MSDPYTKIEIIRQLEATSQVLISTVQRMSEAQFTDGTDTRWSAESYLKHLLLSIKPLAKAIHFPADQLEKRFGLSDHASRPYAKVAAAYRIRLDEGIKAEDYDKVVPAFYRFPNGVTDQREYLLQSWDETNAKIAEGVSRWSEAELDSLQLPHPAIGTITLREILFFTIFHNNLHLRDIQRASGI